MGKKKLQSSTKTLIVSGIASLGTAIGVGLAGYEGYIAEGGHPIFGVVAAAGALVLGALSCVGAGFIYSRGEKKQASEENEENTTLEK